MKKIMIAFVLLIFLASSTAAYASDVSDDNPRAVKIMQVTKEHDGLTGESIMRYSGFYIVGGYVLTAAHLLDEENTKYDVYDGLNRARLTFIAKDDKRDLALFKVPDDIKHGYFDIADSLAIGEVVSSVSSTGFEKFIKQTGKVTALKRETPIGKSGVLSSYNFRMFTDFMSMPGNSGAPVLNKDGEIVGVVVAMNADSPQAKSGQAICVTLEDIKQFLDIQIPNRAH